MFKHLWAFVFVLSLSPYVYAQVCTPDAHTFFDSFDNVTYRDPASSVGSWGTGKITLKAKSSAFDAASQQLNQRVYVVAPGDFDKDGFVDMIALMLDPDCHLHFLRNKGLVNSVHAGFDLGGDMGSLGFDKYRLKNPAGCSTEAPVLVSGDFDGDSDTDLLYLRVTNEGQAGLLAYAYLYEQTGVSGGVPTFTEYNIYSSLSGYNLSWHWTSTVVQTLDFDKDGRSDFVVASSNGTTNKALLFKAKTSGTIGFQAPITLINNLGMYTPIASATQSATGNSACPPGVSRGASAITVADFDKDNDFDIIVGSVSEKNLKYWRNDGTDTFYRVSDIVFAEGAPSLTLAADVDGDGDQDLVVGRDGYNCNGSGGTLWLYLNDGSGTFVKRTTYIAQVGTDIDFGAAFQIDNDLEGKIDIIIADGNNSGLYSQVTSGIASIYTLDATAISKPVDTLSAESDAIVSVKITSLGMSNATPPANTVTYYVSNDDGGNWEPLTAAELPPTSTVHNFVHFGSDLRWKAVLNSKAETLAADEAYLAPASKDTPAILDLGLTYYRVDRRLYSRSGLSYGTVEINGNKHEIVYSASFYFPGYQSTLRAFDLTALTAGTNTNASLERVDNNSNVSVLWDAGELLATRSTSTRVVYAGYAKTSDGDNKINDRLTVNTSELNTPTTNPTLQSMMGLSDSEKTSALNFILGARGDSDNWKLYHIDHSTPVFIAVPTGDSTYLGNNYAQFKEDQKNRQAVVYVGANDGMVHAFDAKTGSELWAFIPNNLLAKMKTQRGFDSLGREVYLHGFFVDGPLTVQDIFDGNSWHTILISGQGLGRGLLEENYYFALDVTNPLDPKPLWEFSDPLRARQACSGEACKTTCTTECVSSPPDTTCSAANHMFVSGASELVMEAEFPHTKSSIKSPHNWIEATDGTASLGKHMTSSPDNGTTCTSINKCGAQLTYSYRLLNTGLYHSYFRVKALNANADSFFAGVNGVVAQTVNVDPDDNSWVWIKGTDGIYSAGESIFNIWMREDGLSIDKMILTQSNSAPTGTGNSATCQGIFVPPVCHDVCVEECIPEGQEWPECGVGAGQKCCEYTSGEHMCTPLNESCGQEPDTVMGETWSAPAVARVKIGSTDKWVAFIGSGYNNRNLTNVGRSFYAIDLLTGTSIGRWDLSDIATSLSNPSTIDNTLPAAPNVIDVDNDGYVDRVYFGDLEGRLWKIDTSKSATLTTEGLIDHSKWPNCVLFDAGDPTGASVRTWAPIITKPGLTILSGKTPNIYFGTGGDDRVPSDVQYRFYSIRDSDANGTCRSSPMRVNDLSIDQGEWIVGDGKQNSPNPTSAPALAAPGDQEGTAGQRYWSDPLVVNDAVYFASLEGSIDLVNPCLTLVGNSKFYGYATRKHTTAAGQVVQPGTSLFTSAWLSTVSKIRQAPVLRAEASDTTAWARNTPKQSAQKADVLIQEFTGESANSQPSIRRVTYGGKEASHNIRVLRWREITQ